MLPEEINKIASEYVKEVYDGDTDFIDEAENVLSWLYKDYHIVPKAKIKELYECGFTGLSGVQTKQILKYIFGNEVKE